MNKISKYLAIAIARLAGKITAQELKSEAFSLLNLDYPGLEKVKELHQNGKDEEAAKALLKYYRARTHVKTPDVDLSKVKISKQEQEWADDALNHTFFVHKGYQPSYNYGEDINWQYWPVKDNELRWQLHRHKWFGPMGKAYRISGDEKYAKAWAHQYMDWIKKNPLVEIDKEEYELTSGNTFEGAKENMRFAWRPLEVSHRLQDQTSQFLLFLSSPSFTPEFLTEFLVNYHKHAVHIMGNYSKQGNHLLFEAQRMIYAGAFFPEYKNAVTWRKSGIEILNDEIKEQVYDDGGQYELDPHYHLAAINIFCKALYMADANGFRNEFPQSYLDTIESMILFYANICFPDYSNPCFSDAKLGDRGTEVRNYKTWAKLFPQNEQIKYFATEGKSGKQPENLSKAFKATGFYTFRNSWKNDATVMVLKAGPKGEWHNQPDNGTFELWFNGKNLFPDSGAYVYAGDDEVTALRNWFRQTMVHNTLTLDDKTLKTRESVCKYWNAEGDVQTLVTETPSYKGLTHRRTVFFVDNTYFVLVDEAYGDAVGEVNLHYQLAEGKVNLDSKAMTVISDYKGNSNVKLQCFGETPLKMKEEEGWRSTDYRKRVERTALSFNTPKEAKSTARFITIIYPFANQKNVPALSAKFNNKQFSTSNVNVEVKVNRKKRTLKTDF
ncbi:heparin-sulfate lyase HepC [Bacteroides sp. 519]|uniref:heparin-sulfate lyase HepC n=1 Tax=Bacteroides sp. 519 TaxID=2302937 RepID=UPI0013CFD45F|nr:heparin-sulfate lyase HepC [Bacteroides sp. 519]NDV57294.1 heparinase [Bacteroides sp. 519]